MTDLEWNLSSVGGYRPRTHRAENRVSAALWCRRGREEAAFSYSRQQSSTDCQGRGSATAFGLSQSPEGEEISSETWRRKTSETSP
jgi:hypothetical protein